MFMVDPLLTSLAFTSCLSIVSKGVILQASLPVSWAILKAISLGNLVIIMDISKLLYCSEVTLSVSSPLTQTIILSYTA